MDAGIDKTIITTASLLSRLEEWEAKVTQDQGSLTAVYEHIAKCLNLTFACLRIEYPGFDNFLKFHLASVAEVLGYAVSKACDVAWTDNLSRTLLPIGWSRTISEPFQKSVLLERSNLCPSQMQMLLRFDSPQTLAFVASCFYENVVQSHHASCGDNQCQAGGPGTSGQVTRHVSDSCGCGFLHVDEDLLADCLRRGCLPLLRLKKETLYKQMSIEVVASTDSTPYVALSHVWADGLGNPTATALPRCQLSRLKTLIDDLYPHYLNLLDHPENAPPELLLWCDTLCCPVVSSEAHDMALRQMYRTYNEASVVLVLDRSLISHPAGGMRIDEACLRIATSRWMTRLWTLQEGALPGRKNRLWFQFSETAMPAWILYDCLKKISTTDIPRRSVAQSVLTRFNNFMRLFDVQSSGDQGAQLEKIMDGLLYRSVTFPRMNRSLLPRSWLWILAQY